MTKVRNKMTQDFPGSYKYTSLYITREGTSTRCFIDFWYLITFSGILKMLEIAFSLTYIIIVPTTGGQWNLRQGFWFLVVSGVISFLASTSTFFMFLFVIPDTFGWYKTSWEPFLNGFLTLCFLCNFILFFVNLHHYPDYSVLVFAILLMLSYALHAIIASNPFSISLAPTNSSQNRSNTRREKKFGKVARFVMQQKISKVKRSKRFHEQI